MHLYFIEGTFGDLTSYTKVICEVIAENEASALKIAADDCVTKTLNIHDLRVAFFRDLSQPQFHRWYDHEFTPLMREQLRRNGVTKQMPSWVG